jgi:hypothetical protein
MMDGKGSTWYVVFAAKSKEERSPIGNPTTQSRQLCKPEQTFKVQG